MNHDHSHHHHHPGNYNRVFALAVVLNLSFVAVEAGYGIVAHSVALLADAGHNASDVLSLVLAWGASLLARRRPSQRFTYGLRSSTILISLLNAILLLLAMGGITWETLLRLSHPEPIAGRVVIGVALVGILINSFTAWLFMSGRHHDLNLRGAFLHMAADAAVSLGVVIAGAVILATGWQWVDPVISLLIVAVVVVGTWQLLKDSLKLALNAVPDTIEPLAVQTFLREQAGVEDIHDLHIWAMSTTEAALTAHLVMPNGHPGDEFLNHLNQALHEHFGIKHSTLQIELGHDCHACYLLEHHGHSH